MPDIRTKHAQVDSVCEVKDQGVVRDVGIQCLAQGHQSRVEAKKLMFCLWRNDLSFALFQ